LLFLLSCFHAPRPTHALHSFPSRRSSDLPSLFTKRSGSRDARPLFPKVQPGQICITWIGHASFLIQTHEANVLIDPIWSMWLSRSEEHTSELQSRENLVCRLLLEKKKTQR